MPHVKGSRDIIFISLLITFVFSVITLINFGNASINSVTGLQLKDVAAVNGHSLFLLILSMMILFSIVIYLHYKEIY